MSGYLEDRSVYEERYDRITVELCRTREQIVDGALGERLPLDSRGDADPANGYYIYSVMYFELVEVLAGERWQEREETIRRWMEEDGAKDRRLADATPAVTPYCRVCGEDMQVRRRNYLHRERRGRKADEEDILFLFECKPCNKRMVLWQDGTEWEGHQARCGECGARVEETDKRRGNTITTTYTCGACGHNHKSGWHLGAKAKTEADPHFKVDRRRFCFDAATGKKFLARKAHLERIDAVVEQARKDSGTGTEPIDPITQAVGGIKRLKVAQVADALAEATAKAGYRDFKLGEPQVGREIAIPFNCLDDRPERESYDSRMALKKLLAGTLADTNWRLMSDGVSYRLGYLSGRVRAYESEDDLRTLAEKKLKASGGKKPAAKSAPAPKQSPRAEPPPAPKRSGRGAQRAIRVRGVLHPNLHVLIPPRETPKPTAKAKKKR